MDLQNKVALITGGKRIGAVVARELAARGADVAFSYARSKAAAEQAAETVRATGRRADAFQADLSQPGAAAVCRPDSRRLERRDVRRPPRGVSLCARGSPPHARAGRRTHRQLQRLDRAQRPA